MSECKICKGNGKPGVQITWSDKIRSQYSQKMIPLETDGSTFHKHYEPTKTNESNPTPAVARAIIPTNEVAVPKTESLNQINFGDPFRNSARLH
jgi:hypothetical protein